MGLNDLINWYQSHGALDLGSTRINEDFVMRLRSTLEEEGLSFTHKGTDKRKVWIMMKFLHQLPELKQSDSFWHLHLSWALLSIRWMSKVHFCMATSQKRYIGSFIINLKPSARGCNNPNDPTTSGPFRRCTKATPSRSGRIIPSISAGTAMYIFNFLHDISLMIWPGRPNHDIEGWDIFSKKKGDSISSSNPFLEDAVKEEIRLVENLLYDKSSPRPPKELNLEIADTIFESLSPSPILVVDCDSLMEEIDLFLAFDDSMPPGIEDDDY
ncbi:hypothetical protein Tco_0728594, partial [Tanacetum coccineum]